MEYSNETVTLTAKHFEDLVREGRWTLDALIENSKGVYIDEDASGTKTGADMYGFTQATYFDTDAFYFGSGLSFFKADDFEVHSLHLLYLKKISSSLKLIQSITDVYHYSFFTCRSEFF